MTLTQHHLCVYFGHLYKSFDNNFPDLRAPKLEGGISDIIICSCSSHFLKFDSRSDEESVSSVKSSGRSSSWNEAAATGVLERVVYKINVILNEWNFFVEYPQKVTSYSVKLSISPHVIIIPIILAKNTAFKSIRYLYGPPKMCKIRLFQFSEFAGYQESSYRNLSIEDLKHVARHVILDKMKVQVCDHD